MPHENRAGSEIRLVGETLQPPEVEGFGAGTAGWRVRVRVVRGSVFRVDRSDPDLGEVLDRGLEHRQVAPVDAPLREPGGERLEQGRPLLGAAWFDGDGHLDVANDRPVDLDGLRHNSDFGWLLAIRAPRLPCAVAA